MNQEVIPVAENKQYITQTEEKGTVLISEEVVCAIVAHSVMEVEGVVGIGGKVGADKKNWGKGMKITISESNDVSVDCNIVVAFGYAVMNVAKAAQDAIVASVSSMTGVKPTVVNIGVSGIVRQ